MNHHFFKTIMAGALAAAMILGGAGCKKTEKQVVNVTAFSLSERNLELKIGETKQLDVSFYPENATLRPEIFWESGDEKVATVSKDGLVTAIGSGKAVVTVRTRDGSLSETCGIYVITQVTALTLSVPKYIWGGADSDYTITFTSMPSNAVAADFIWEVDKKDVINLWADNGVVYVRALADGKSTLTVTPKDGDKSIAKTATVQAYKRRFGVFPKTDAQVSLSGDGIEDGATIDMSKVKTHFGQPAIFIGANGFGGGALVDEFEIIVEDKGIVKVAEINKFPSSTMALCIQLPLGTGSGTAQMTIKNTMYGGNGSVLNTYTREFTLLVPETTTTE